MKLSVFLFLLGIMSVQANEIFSQTNLNIQMEKASIEEIIEKIQEQTDYDFIYDYEYVKDLDAIDVDFTNAKMDAVLYEILKNTNLDYRLEENLIVLFPREVVKPKEKAPSQKVQQDKIELRGTVTDKDGETLPGVSVIEKGTTNGVATDINGNYTIVLENDNAVLVYSFVGMQTQEIAITDQTVLNIKLNFDSSSLDEVVVTGLQNVPKPRMTGAVQSVDAASILESGVTSMDQALRGTLMGVSVTNMSGRPGETAQIRIRGLNSLTGDMNPIWIVDGFELDAGAPDISGGDLQGSVMTNGIGTVAPEDIKSITVLKDAAASAIYGARAANGVIVVETKKGTAGEPVVKVSTKWSLAEAPTNNLFMMNSKEKIAYEKYVYNNFGSQDLKGDAFRIYQNMNNGIEPDGEAKLAALANINTDWFDHIYRDAITQRHSISISGGTDQTQYYSSVNYSNEEGVLKDNLFSNFNSTLKIDHKVFDNLRVETKLSASVIKDKIPAPSRNVFEYATFANPYQKVYNEDGSYAYDRSYVSNYDYVYNVDKYDFNMLESMEQNKSKTKSNSLTFSGRLIWDITKNINYTSAFNYVTTNNISETYADAGTNASFMNSWAGSFDSDRTFQKANNNGFLREQSSSNESWSLRNSLNFNYSKGSHFVQAMVAQQVKERRVRSFWNMMPEYDDELKIGGYPDFADKDYNVSMMSALGGTRRDVSKESSFFGNINYSYDDRYVVGASVRYDGVDIIGDQNQFAPLWNVSCKWNAHKEGFLSNITAIDALSIRASYGYTGSIDRSVFPFSVLSYSFGAKYNGIRFPYSINWKSPSVKWQKKLDRSVGVDFALLNNRISGEFNYYVNETSDLIDRVALPISSGRSEVKANVSSIENKGYELGITTVNLDVNDFRWTTRFDFSILKNKITKSYTKDITDIIPVSRYTSAGASANFVQGHNASEWYGYKSAGIDPVTGNSLAYVNDMSKVNDWDIHSMKNGKAVIDMDENFNHEATVSSLGVSFPKISGGFSTSINYKQLSFSSQFTYAAGNKIRSVSRKDVSGFDPTKYNQLTNEMNRWKEVGDNTNMPELRDSYLDNSEERYFYDTLLEDGDYLKWTSLSVGYYLPRNFVNKLNIQRVRLSFNIANVKTWTKYKGLDPENYGAFAYPMARTYTFGVSVDI